MADQVAAWGGRIDTWVNNASVAITFRLDELPDDEARQLFEVNFWAPFTAAGQRCLTCRATAAR